MKAWRFIEDVADGFVAHADLTLAASISYYTALSLAPLLVLGLWLAASVSPGAQTEIVHQIGQLAGDDAATAIQVIVDNASNRPSLGSIAGLLGVVLLLLSATAVFSQLQTALNVVWNVEAAERDRASIVWGWVRRRLLSIGILAAFAFVLIVSLAISTMLSMLLSSSGEVWDLVNQIVAFFVFALLFAALFRYLPDRRMPWRETWFGAAITSLLFSAGKYAIGEYVSHTGLAGSYGPAGSLAVLLVWVYYSATIFLLGAEIARAMATVRTQRHGRANAPAA